MLDLGWPELLVVALVLIIVVGPKDLPAMLRAFGHTTRKLRSMAGEFRSQFDEALKEAELDGVRSVISEAQQLNPKSILKDVVDPIAEVGNEIKSDLNKTKSDLDKTMKAATEPSPPSKPEAAKPNGDAGETAKVEAKPKTQKKPAKSPAKSTANGAAKKKPATTASRTRKTAVKPASKPTAAKRSAAKKPAASKSAKSSGDAA